jgi:hypothetical protein
MSSRYMPAMCFSSMLGVDGEVLSWTLGCWISRGGNEDVVTYLLSDRCEVEALLAWQVM